MKLDALIDQVLYLVKERGYTEGTWKHGLRNGRFSSLRQFFEERGAAEFDTEIARDYMAFIQKRHKKGEISYSRCAHLVKLASWFIEVFETGELRWKSRRKSKIEVNRYFGVVMAEYMASKGKDFSKSSAAGIKSNLLHLLGYLQNAKGYADFSSLDHLDIHGFIEHTAQRRKRPLGNVVYYTKSFLAYLYERNIVDRDLSASLPPSVPRRERVLPCFTHDEADRILTQPNRDTPIGKRDYAMLLLARDTGLRRGDIANIKLSDIDWRNGSLTVTQGKTKNPLTLPVEPGVKCAIADYILNGRPKADCKNIFLRQHAPHVGLSPQNIGTIFIRYKVGAGIDHVPHDGKSMHALRRSIASWMLESGAPLETVSQVLGHRDMDSAKRYLSYDDANLKKCALSLRGIEVAKEGLLG